MAVCLVTGGGGFIGSHLTRALVAARARVTVVTPSRGHHESSIRLLEADGVSAEVIDVATLKPLDSEGLLASVTKTGRCVIVHEAPLTGGVGAEIEARVQPLAA